MESDCEIREPRFPRAKTCVPLLHQINAAWLACEPSAGQFSLTLIERDRFRRTGNWRTIALAGDRLIFRARVIFVISPALIRTLPLDYSWAQFHRSLSIIQSVDWFDLKTSLTTYFYSFHSVLKAEIVSVRSKHWWALLEAGFQFKNSLTWCVTALYSLNFNLRNAFTGIIDGSGFRFFKFLEKFFLSRTKIRLECEGRKNRFLLSTFWLLFGLLCSRWKAYESSLNDHFNCAPSSDEWIRGDFLCFCDCFLELANALIWKLIFCKSCSSEAQVWVWNLRPFREIKLILYFYRCRKHQKGQLIADRNLKDHRNQFEWRKAPINNQWARLLEHLAASEMQFALANLDRHWPSRFDSTESRFPAVVKLTPAVRSALILELRESFLSCLSIAPR